MPAKRRLLVDTVIVIEACRIGIWNSLAAHFALETVDKCVEEAQTGPKGLPQQAFVTGLAAVHSIVDRDRQMMVLAEESTATLDDGERDLFAWVFKNGGPGTSLLISTADKAAIVSATRLNWGDRLISLEAAAQEAHVSKAALRNLEDHFSENWLSQIRTKIRLGVIP